MKAMTKFHLTHFPSLICSFVQLHLAPCFLLQDTSHDAHQSPTPQPAAELAQQLCPDSHPHFLC
jgi:hypothetical protein